MLIIYRTSSLFSYLLGLEPTSFGPSASRTLMPLPDIFIFFINFIFILCTSGNLSLARKSNISARFLCIQSIKRMPAGGKPVISLLRSHKLC